jgi:hypothetical protein
MHTPGPWTAEETTTYPSFEAAKAKRGGVKSWQVRSAEPVMFGGTVLIERVGGKEINTKGIAERKANARVIAAAPDMLAALQEIVELYATGGDIGQMFDVARGAVEKALQS